MPIILALDTSTDACSCAIWHDGVLFEDFAVIPRQHARRILPMVRDLLARTGLDFGALDAIAFGRGPGSFTGLRIAAGVTQGLAYAAALPVVPVSTLAALALQVREQAGGRAVLGVIDARIEEVYWGLLDNADEAPRFLGEERLSSPEALALDAVAADAELVAVGSGLALRERFPAAVRSRLVMEFPDEHPRAGAIARIAAIQYARAGGSSAMEVEPLYLRDQVAKVPGCP